MWMPAKRLARVSWRARATARPPTPRAVSSGAMEMPRVCRTTRMPIASTTTRVMLTKIVADPATPGRDWATARTRPVIDPRRRDGGGEDEQNRQDLVDVVLDPAGQRQRRRRRGHAAGERRPGDQRAQRVDDDVVPAPAGPVRVLAQPAQQQPQQDARRKPDGHPDAGDDQVVRGEVAVHQLPPVVPGRGRIARYVMSRHLRHLLLDSGMCAPAGTSVRRPAGSLILPYPRACLAPGPFGFRPSS